MYDLGIVLKNNPGALSQMGKILGAANVSVEGGGAWTVEGEVVAHFLFEDGEKAKQALEAEGIRVTSCQRVLVQRLDQEVPGQLGTFTGLMADAGINIEVMYSDHDNQLILVVDDYEAGSKVSDAWSRD